MHIEGWIHSVHFGGIDTHVNFRRMDTQCGGMNTQCGFRGLDITVRSYCVYRECHGGPALHKEIYILNLSSRVLAKAIAGGSPPRFCPGIILARSLVLALCVINCACGSRLWQAYM